ncbi:MAG TPA: hypothetical protein VNW46_19225 [Gemmatimonadaceae bacterium]|nr:hypothetical protein [Gemmatimonadaceae bacterium]
MHPELSKQLTLAQLEEALRSGRLFDASVELEEVSYPTFFVRFRTIRGYWRLFRFECTDYDYQPLDVEPVDPDTRSLLPASAWPLRDNGAFPAHAVHNGAPFLCISGTRKYYTHEGHRPQVTGNRWEQHRPDTRIPDLIGVIRERFATGRWI